MDYNIQGTVPPALSVVERFFFFHFCFSSVLLCDVIFTELTYSQPFTNNFPRADIHELLSPDLLHQVIKGTFKDHLVTWIESYLLLTHGEARSKEILDDIDRRCATFWSCNYVMLNFVLRIAAAATFAGLRRFNEGRGFKQWTGDDSKALMKVHQPVGL